MTHAPLFGVGGRQQHAISRVVARLRGRAHRASERECQTSARPARDPPRKKGAGVWLGTVRRGTLYCEKWNTPGIGRLCSNGLSRIIIVTFHYDFSIVMVFFDELNRRSDFILRLLNLSIFVNDYFDIGGIDKVY